MKSGVRWSAPAVSNTARRTLRCAMSHRRVDTNSRSVATASSRPARIRIMISVTLFMVHCGVWRLAGCDCERFLQRIRVFGRRFTQGAGRDFLGFPAWCRVTARVRTVVMPDTTFSGDCRANWRCRPNSGKSPCEIQRPLPDGGPRLSTNPSRRIWFQRGNGHSWRGAQDRCSTGWCRAPLGRSKCSISAPPSGIFAASLFSNPSLNS